MLKFYKSVKISTKKANVAKIRFCIDESLSYDFELDVRSECYEKKKDIIILKEIILSAMIIFVRNYSTEAVLLSFRQYIYSNFFLSNEFS